MWGALSDHTTGLMFTFYCLKFETPQPGEPGPLIYIPQEQGGPVIPPDTGFPFHCLLRLAGLRSSVCSLDKDRTENVCFNFARSLVDGKTYPQSCFLATAVVLSPVYTAVTWQWVYMSQYLTLVTL
jgi:hypothetical protein